MTERKQPPWQAPQAKAAYDTGVRTHNSMTREKDLFVATGGRQVTWYSCGPTVYDSSHMGHARTYLSFDIIRRIMENYFGYNVFMVMNITDVDDKIILKARQNFLFDDFAAKNARVTPRLLATARDAWALFIAGLEAKKKDADDAKDTTLANLFAGKIRDAEKAAKEAAEAKENDDATGLVRAARDALSVYLDKQHGHEAWINIQERFRAHAEVYEREYFEDMDALNIRRPDVLTRVSEYMPEVVEFVRRIVEKGFGYEVNGSVYFDTVAFDSAEAHDYGKLDPAAIGDLRLLAEGEGALKGAGDKTKTKNDFALWKKSKPGEPSWESPWGKGRPGWHIECSAMAGAILGENMDIHSGGQDLKFPHHDNEMAQSEAYFGCKQWVNYFWHTGKLNIEGLKMAKSLKNFVTIREALAEYSARQIRLLFLFKRWDSSMNYSTDAMEDIKQKERAFFEFFLQACNLAREQRDTAACVQRWSARETAFHAQIVGAQEAVDAALKDNFDTPTAMLAILDVSRSILVDKAAHFVARMLRVFGVIENDPVRVANYGFGASGDAAAAAAAAAGGDGALDRTSVLAPVLDVLTAFRTTVRETARGGGDDARALRSSLLQLCDALRDDVLPPLGVRVEDSGTFPWKLQNAAELMAEIAAKQAEAAAEAERKSRARLGVLTQQLERQRNAAVPPERFFATTEGEKFSAYDASGLPTHAADGEALSKGAAKKLAKRLAAQRKAHDAWLKKGGEAGVAALRADIAALEAQLAGEAPATAATTTTSAAAAAAAASKSGNTCVVAHHEQDSWYS